MHHEDDCDVCPSCGVVLGRGGDEKCYMCGCELSDATCESCCEPSPRCTCAPPITGLGEVADKLMRSTLVRERERSHFVLEEGDNWGRRRVMRETRGATLAHERTVYGRKK